MDVRTAWKAVYRIERLKRAGQHQPGRKEDTWVWQFLEWAKLVPSILAMTLEWSAEELTAFGMDPGPSQRTRETKTSFRERAVYWRKERREKLKMWKEDIADRTVAWRLMNEFSGWWSRKAYELIDLKPWWNYSWKASGIISVRQADRWFVHDRGLADSKCKWASNNPGRWKKYEAMPAWRKYWPGWGKGSEEFLRREEKPLVGKESSDGKSKRRAVGSAE